MKLSNPFVISGYRGPEYFCDRVTETERLCTIVRNEGHVTLLAPRRYGKTGLIHNAFARLRQEDGYETFYVDVFGTQNLAEFTSALAHAVIGRLDTPLEKVTGAAKRLMQGLRPTLSYDETSGKPTLSFEISAEAAHQTLERVFAYLAEHDRRTVIAIDEFQQVADYPEKGVEAQLRSLVQFSPAQFVFAGSKQHLMREMFTSPKKPFFQSTTLLPLDVIGEDVYCEFAQRFFAAAGRRLSRAVFEAIYRRFDGITWYVQALLWNFYARGGDAVEVSEVDEMVRARVEDNEYDSQRLLALLPDGARRLLKAIACEGVVKAPQSGAFIAAYGLRAASSVKVSLEMLIDKELVYPGKAGYVVYDRLMAEYLRRMRD